MSIYDVLLLALLPAAGNFAGGLIALWISTPGRVLNYALHAATGIILAVISVEVMPSALEAASSWMLSLAFFMGGLAYLVLQGAINRMEKMKGADSASASVWLIYLAVAGDLVGDGLLIGTSSAVSFDLALILAVGQVLADVPEGFAVSATFRSKGFSRAKGMLVSASFIIPILSAATIAFFSLRTLDASFKMSALVFVAGIYVLAALEDMMEEAHERAVDSRWSAVSFLAGFSLFVLVA